MYVTVFQTIPLICTCTHNFRFFFNFEFWPRPSGHLMRPIGLFLNVISLIEIFHDASSIFLIKSSRDSAWGLPSYCASDVIKCALYP